MEYKDLSKEQLKRLLDEQYEIYNSYKNMGLSYDMTRGKPCKAQLDASNDMMDFKYIEGYKTEQGQEVRNYGILEGIPEARRLMGEMLGAKPEETVVCGNASLTIMYDTLMKFLVFGVGNGEKPWIKNDKIKFLCPVPGYDRHFGITEKLGFEMINIELQDDGPDMDKIEALVATDPSIKGMWMVPKYSNPSGIVYSDEKIRRLASMKTAASDFRIICDDAYTVHYLYDGPAKQLNMLTACKEAGNPDRVIMVGSTSKITFPGAGISALCASENNIKYLLSHLTVQSISFDKVNMLRHVRYLKDYNGILAQMKKHADILRPKFESVDKILTEGLGGLGILRWTKPEGGYFVSVDTLDGCATRVVELCKECGVKFTPAGSTFPYKKDPHDSNIRLAPSFPPIEELEIGIKVFVVAVKIASIEKFLNA